MDLEEVFTTDLASTPVHVAKWGFLGESWPFFRPNFVNMEQYRTDVGVDEVRQNIQSATLTTLVSVSGPCLLLTWFAV